MHLVAGLVSLERSLAAKGPVGVIVALANPKMDVQVYCECVRREVGYVYRASMMPTEDVSNMTARRLHQRCYEALRTEMSRQEKAELAWRYPAREPARAPARKPVRFAYAHGEALQHLVTAAIALREDDAACVIQALADLCAQITDGVDRAVDSDDDDMPPLLPP